MSIIAEAAGNGDFRDTRPGSLQQVYGAIEANQPEMLAKRATQKTPEATGFMLPLLGSSSRNVIPIDSAFLLRPLGLRRNHDDDNDDRNRCFKKTLGAI